jgi:hypothetical protein
MSKATKRQMIEREEDIRDNLSAGRELRSFAPDLAKKHRCSELSIKRQYYQILNEMVEQNKGRRDELRVKLMERNDYLYQRALRDNNIKQAADINNLQAKIGGLYQPDTKQEAEKPRQPVFNIVANDSKVVPMVSDEEDGTDTN